MKNVIVRGPALSRSGYGEHCRALLRALRTQEENYNLYLINTGWGETGWLFEDNDERNWIDGVIMKTVAAGHARELQNIRFDVSLQVQLPTEWEPLAKKNIGIFAGIETTKASEAWANGIKMMDQVIVPSEHSRECFESYDAEITDKFNVIGFPFRGSRSSSIDLDLKSEFNFLNVSQWSNRKNVEQTIFAFLEEFKNEDVGLVLKAFIKNGSHIDRHYIEERLKMFLKGSEDRKCRIHLLHGTLSDKEMSALYEHNKIKCYVSTSRGEGFGLPTFEAACHALPIIAPNWGGHKDFLSIHKTGKSKKKELAALDLAYTLENVAQRDVWEDVLIPDSQWCYPDMKSLRENMREIYSNWRPSKRKANRLQTNLSSRFKEETINTRINDVIVSVTKEIENEVK